MEPFLVYICIGLAGLIAKSVGGVETKEDAEQCGSKYPVGTNYKT